VLHLQLAVQHLRAMLLHPAVQALLLSLQPLMLMLSVPEHQQQASVAVMPQPGRALWAPCADQRWPLRMLLIPLRQALTRHAPATRPVWRLLLLLLLPSPLPGCRPCFHLRILRALQLSCALHLLPLPARSHHAPGML
jgi:hypothetical protein